MRRVYSLFAFISFFSCLLIIQVFSVEKAESSQVIIYPPNYASITSTYKVKVKDQLFTISSLPLGMDEKNIFVMYPVKLWKYRYDLSGKSNFLNQIIGKSIKCKIDNDIKEYQLVGINDNQIFLKKKNNIIVVPKNNSFIFSVNEKLALFPSLEIQFYPDKKEPKNISVSYLINTILSEITYNADFNDAKNIFSLSCFLQLNNNSGLDINATKLEIHLGQIDFNNQDSAKMFVQNFSKDNGGVQEKNDFFLYRFNNAYSLDKASQINLPIFSDEKFLVKKTYVFTIDSPLSKNNKISKPLDIELCFKNRLRMPLPAGKIQLFSDGILMGSTYLPYTSRDKDIAITMGKMPDIWGQKIKVNEVKLTKSSFKDTYKIIISNYKLKPATVMIKDVVFGNNWRIANSSLNYNKKSANEIVYSLTVPANTSQEINYDVIRDAQ